jgi:hypothetical protein
MGKQFQNSVVVSSNTGLIGTGSVYAQQTIGAAAAEIKVGGSKLSGRKSVTLCAHPDNTGYIYIGMDNTVTASKYWYVLAGGAGITIELDPAAALGVWAYGSAAGQLLGVLEGIS